MPRASANLAVNARVSVKRHYLRSTTVYQALRSIVALDAPEIRLRGTITEAPTVNGRNAWMVKLEDLPDSPVALFSTSLKYEGPRMSRAVSVSAAAAVQAAAEEDVDNLDDAIAESEESDQGENDEEINLAWREGRVDIDTRVSRPLEAFAGSVSLHLSAKEYATPAQYFLRFLPERYIREVCYYRHQ